MEPGDSPHTSVDGYPTSTQTFNHVTLPSENSSSQRLDTADQMNKAAMDAVRTYVTTPVYDDNAKTYLRHTSVPSLLFSS